MSDRLNSLLKLIEKDPDDSFLLYGIALEHLSTGNYEEAEKYLSSIIKKDPDYVPAYMQLAQVYENLNLIDKAKNIYKEGIEIARKNNDSHAADEMEDFLNELK